MAKSAPGRTRTCDPRLRRRNSEDKSRSRSALYTGCHAKVPCHRRGRIPRWHPRTSLARNSRLLAQEDASVWRSQVLDPFGDGFAICLLDWIVSRQAHHTGPLRKRSRLPGAFGCVDGVRASVGECLTFVTEAANGRRPHPHPRRSVSSCGEAITATVGLNEGGPMTELL